MARVRKLDALPECQNEACNMCYADALDLPAPASDPPTDGPICRTCPGLLSSPKSIEAGLCEWCRLKESRSAPTCGKCPAFLYSEESRNTGLCHGCRSPGPSQVVTAPPPSAKPAEDRKATPVCTGCLDYFPLALKMVARLSKIGNDKHNPGMPLHWSKDKSADHADALARHLLERGTTDPDTGLTHSAAVAWRALALLETELEAARGA